MCAAAIERAHRVGICLILICIKETVAICTCIVAVVVVVQVSVAVQRQIRGVVCTVIVS